MSKIAKQKYKLEIICPNCGNMVTYSSKTKTFQCRNCGFADYDEDGMIKVKTIKTERVVEEPTASPLQPLLNIVESYKYGDS